MKSFSIPAFASKGMLLCGIFLSNALPMVAKEAIHSASSPHLRALGMETTPVQSVVSNVVGYSLDDAIPQHIRQSSDPVVNSWLSSNFLFSAASSFDAAPTPGSAPLSKTDLEPGAKQFMLPYSTSGFYIENAKPEYYLGDLLNPPDNVDWDATFEDWRANKDEQVAFLFDHVDKRIFVINGGTHSFVWHLLDGKAMRMSYNISPNSQGRPYRIFWTEPPYNAPAINLRGKFVKFFGPDSIVHVKRGVTTNYVGQKEIVSTNNITSGIFLDPTSGLLKAFGELRGQFLLAYYDSGRYDNIKHMQSVEVGPPDVISLKGEIGRAIRPDGTGYNPKGLYPVPHGAHEEGDARGPYYYQHKGAYSYSPKNGEVYPLRETTDCPWRLPIYWMEEDIFGTSWPFELCHYACSWPEDAQYLIAGAKVVLPEAYQVELMKYQEPEGNALAPAGQIFATQSSGHSLLRLSANDNVWFVAVHSIDRDDPKYFALTNQLQWAVGEKLQPLKGIHPCHSETYAPIVDSKAPGWINPGVSGLNYHPGLYKDPSVPHPSGEGVSSGAGNGTNEYPSAIIAVNVGTKPLEVWWSGTQKQQDMPLPIYFPCAIDRYGIVWPELDTLPQIVLASGRGSEAPSIVRTGQNLLFRDDTSIEISDRQFFSNLGGGVSFWTRMDRASRVEGQGALLTLGADGGGPKLFIDQRVERGKGGAVSVLLTSVWIGKDNGYGKLSIEMPPDDNWHKVTFAYHADYLDAEDGQRRGSALVASIDGKVVAREWLERPLDVSGVSSGNWVGACGARRAYAGFSLDELLIVNKPFSPSEKVEWLYRKDSGTLPYATAFISADNPRRLAINLRDADDIKIRESVFNDLCESANVKVASPGAPKLESGLLFSDDRPLIYSQRNRAEVGFNPNEEHGFVDQGGDGAYRVWALRCDLNIRENSEPVVLAEYTRDSEKWMQAYSVVATNALYPELAGDMTVGAVLPGPHPLDLFDDPWLKNDFWDAKGAYCIYRDRKKQLWGRAPGTFKVYMFYPNQPGFDYPSLAENPPIGKPVPWLGYFGSGLIPGESVLEQDPYPWTWRSSWPKNLKAMRIGQTLTKASGGLPEVWNASSLSVVYPDPTQSNLFEKTALLYDPTIARFSGGDGYESPSALVKAMGFAVGPKGDVTLRAGKYHFHSLPPSISDRFYINANRPAQSCIVLEGKLEEKTGGASILYPNVLNDEEKMILKSLVCKDKQASNNWAKAIDILANSPVKPSTLQWVGQPKSDGNVQMPGTEVQTTYAPRDHYALTAMGGTGPVVLIENDSTDPLLGVDEGDPISMHVFTVTNDYYTGRVVTRQDAKNLLSEQLSVIYTEAFAGKADDFIFEWKKSAPEADGRVPTDFENGYTRKFDLASSGGLTRFILGKQGDTLADMVNAYYACRYKAKPGTTAHQSMGDRWSDWCGPALAEGWVQRVLNNVTPFAQRMRDLYENKAETSVTMLQQAGAPYEGDVALNQENLTQVGLIQLYQTILNKAESLSLNLKINDRDVNKQLQLAVGRLADLYMVLGNEALADALNPTIGFGLNGPGGKSVLAPGSSYTSLFCFDNQVPTLLDEELALLRGRTDENAPGVRTPPYYNRLVWNFTKGIHAGEVAYAVNYNINSENGDAVLNEEDAAAQFPQGHGDAYGHYLSALSCYYRLLRNPYFSWGPPSMGEMVVNDAVVNVDYYDEARFAEIADKVAETTVLTVDRTARKTWQDMNLDEAGAGYLDEDPTRSFGYGDWATRGGVGAMMNWMVANSMLPEPPEATQANRLSFTEDGYAYMKETPLSLEKTPAWTVEAQFEKTILPADGEGVLFAWDYQTNRIEVAVGSNGMVRASHFSLHLHEVSSEENPKAPSISSDSADKDDPASSLEKPTIVETNILERLDLGRLPGKALLALSGGERGDPVQIRLCDVDAATVVASREVASTAQQNVHDQSFLSVGGRLHTAPSELRIWKSERTDEALLSHASIVNGRDASLLAYSRTISMHGGENELFDETKNETPWHLVNPLWTSTRESKNKVAFTDKGLLRIDRSTSPSLQSLPKRLEDIQAMVDRLDVGMNPLGLSQHAIPFDITPLGNGDSSKTHFMQIASRARKALSNAAQILDNAQALSSRLRMIESAAQAEAETARTEEESFKAQLIGYYGYPYEGDIGPSGTYPQGYDGPDLFHFMWLDLDRLGIKEVESQKCAIINYRIKKEVVGNESGANILLPSWFPSQFLFNRLTEKGTNTLSWLIAPNGVIQKPDNILGQRRATGKIQKAYADYLAAYAEVLSSTDWLDQKTERLLAEVTSAEMSLVIQFGKMAFFDGLAIKAYHMEPFVRTAHLSLLQIESALQFMKENGDDVQSCVPDEVGIGMTEITDPNAAFMASIVPSVSSTRAQLIGARQKAKVFIYDDEHLKDWQELLKELIIHTAEYVGEVGAIRERLLSKFEAQWQAREAVKKAYARMQVASDNLEALVAEAERLSDKQMNARLNRVNHLTKARYNDMYCRQLRSEVLRQYDAAFSLAQKYVYLAAQVYDYETALLSSAPEAGDAFRREIIAARSIGQLGKGGEPMQASGEGDPGLSDILARMEGNWAVLAPRLGINNPEKNATWFSLRWELFRISKLGDGDENWRRELAKYWVDDLRSLPEYRRFCQPFSSTQGLAAKEPGFVIPFSTDIDFGLNFFGKPLMPGDSAFDSTYFSTKIAGAGVRLVGYNEKVNGYNGPEMALAATPAIYLLPLGTDRMRVPGSGERSQIVDFNIVDQVVPVPYAVGSSDLDKMDWQPFHDGYTGGVDPAARIRRYPSFRAVTGAASDGGLSSTRLVGRSVWNTRWMIVIPAGAMCGGDEASREKVLDLFLNGKDLDNDHRVDISGVRDIELGLKSYSNSGN